MRFFLRFILVGGLGYAASLFFPWWTAAIVGFLVGLFLSQKPNSNSRGRLSFTKPRPPARAFLAGFLALFIVWGSVAFLLDSANDSILSTKIFQLILPGVNLPVSGALMMVFDTGLIGGLIGGFSTMTGNLLGEAVRG
jgi:hypothetical protein